MHRVSPISFRLGKTYPWKFNVLLPMQYSKDIADGSHLGFNEGLEGFSNILLERYDAFTIRAVIKYSPCIDNIFINLLFIPRMRQPNIEGFRTTTAYTHNFLFSPRKHKSQGEEIHQKLLQYTAQRLCKTALPKLQRYRRINP